MHATDPRISEKDVTKKLKITDQAATSNAKITAEEAMKNGNHIGNRTMRSTVFQAFLFFSGRTVFITSEDSGISDMICDTMESTGSMAATASSSDIPSSVRASIISPKNDMRSSASVCGSPDSLLLSSFRKASFFKSKILPK